MEIDRNGLEVLDRDECLRLLSSHRFGRVAVSSGALPTILPVNYWCDDDRVYVRTSAGSKLEAAVRDAVVAFEVDDIDPVEHIGWSVVVTGVAHHVTDPDELERVRRAPLARWAPRWDGHVMAISTERVTGRRVEHLLDAISR